MRKLGNIAKLIEGIIKYLPVILAAFEALHQVKEKIEEIEKDKNGKNATT